MYFVSKDVFIFQKLYEDYGAEIYYNTLNDVVEPILILLLTRQSFIQHYPKQFIKSLLNSMK